MKWWYWMPWSLCFECWVLSQLFHSFTFIKRLFSSSSLSAIRVVSSAYLKLLIFFPAILTPACDSYSLTFHMVYSACKLNKQGDNILPWHTPLPIWNLSIVPCLVLTVSSWRAYRFLRRQVRWCGTPISWRIFQIVVIYTVKGFNIVNEAEVDIFLEFFSYDPMNVGNLISGSSAFLNPACTSGSSQFKYCWSLAWRILSITLLPCEMSIIVR